MENTCTHLSRNVRMRRAAPQAASTFSKFEARREKHLAQEPKWVLVNKTVSPLLFESEPR